MWSYTQVWNSTQVHSTSGIPYGEHAAPSSSTTPALQLCSATPAQYSLHKHDYIYTCTCTKYKLHVCISIRSHTVRGQSKLQRAVSVDVQRVCPVIHAVLYLQFPSATGSVHSMPLPPDLSKYTCSVRNRFTAK